MAETAVEKIAKFKKLLRDAESLAATRSVSKQAAWNRRKFAEAADIGPIRAVVNPERRESCRLSLLLFLVTYFPNTTGLRPFCDDQQRVVARIQDVVLRGGRDAKALPRGFAKTTISENSALWAILYGHRRFVALFGASQPKASEMMESIKSELASNDLLDEDFPEATQAVRALEGKPQRCASQTCEGEPTHIEWTADKVVLPMIRGSACAAAVITAHGITSGSIRGTKHKRADGVQQRPDLAIVDDPQTEESAENPLQVSKRMGIIRKVILRLAGHRYAIACIVNGTIIQPDDLMDRLTNHDKCPDFQSERVKMMRRMADAHESFWMAKYASLRNDYDPKKIGDQARAHADATESYRQNREMAEAGAEPSWEWCYNEEGEAPELSAIQHAYNILIDDGEEVFASECQNDPLEKSRGGDKPLKAEDMCAKLNNIPRGTVPAECSRLTAFIDVHLNVLYYVVCAWGDGFSGAVIDYGTFPDQGLPHFEQRSAKHTLEREFPGRGEEGAIYAGLQVLIDRLMSRDWPRDGSGTMRIEKCLIDTGYKEGVVAQACRQSAHRTNLLPSKGHGLKAGQTPMRNWEAKPGQRMEPTFARWVIRRAQDKAYDLCQIDTYEFKDFLFARLKSHPGTQGCLSLFGSKPQEHQLFAEHLTSEYSVHTFGRGRHVNEWKTIPNRDNHWLDCLVGCAVGASVCGCQLHSMQTVQKRSRVPLSQMGKSA